MLISIDVALIWVLFHFHHCLEWNCFVIDGMNRWRWLCVYEVINEEMTEGPNLHAGGELKGRKMKMK